MTSRSKRIFRYRSQRETQLFIKSSSSSYPLTADDYQPPSTWNSLSPNSKWLIVRNNLHKIRSWGAAKSMSNVDKPFQDWYLFFQMRRELKRAEEQIRSLEHRSDFHPITHFDLPLDEKRTRRYDVSHVSPNEGIYYAGLGTEPIVLQSLLYYFSQHCPVPYNSLFYSFLCDVNSVLHTNLQRRRRLIVLQRISLIFAVTIFIILFLMFFSLIISVIQTISNFQHFYSDRANWASSQPSRSTWLTL